MDVATLAIKVENGDVVKATTALDSLTVAGGKSEAATQRLTRRMALLQIEARQMDAAMNQMHPAVAKLTAAFGALSAVAALGFLGRETLKNTEEAQNAMAQLEAAVKSTGGAAGRTVAQLDALSMALQKTTTFSDEAVKGAQAMLLTFDKIRGAEFDRATAAVTDLAARMGGDLQGAAVQVGKALQDPTTGLTALRRSGVSFSESQIEVIKKLYETGRAAEGQRVILAELEHQFGGSAAAARDTLGGALTGLKNAFGDLLEVSRGAAQGTVTAINAITKSMQDSGLSMNQFVLNTVVGWEKIKAAAQKAHEIMSLPIGPGFFDRAKAISERIDFDLSGKLAELNAPAKTGPPLIPPPRTNDGDTKQAAKDLAELQKATDAYYNSLNQHQIDAVKAAGATRDQNAALREMIVATMQGQDAVDALTIAQAGANAVRDLGVGVSEKAAAAVRQEAQENARLSIELGHVQQAQKDADAAAKKASDDQARANERRVRDMSRSASNIIAEALDGLGQKGVNIFQTFWDMGKRSVNRFIADILGARIGDKFGELMGFGPSAAATKQVAAGAVMLQAATLQVQAAHMMLTGRSSGTAGGIVIDDPGAGRSRWSSALGVGATIAGAGLTAYNVGQSLYSTSHGAAGNYARGALGGAAAGAVVGSMIMPGVGTAVGALVGFAAGIIGVGSAAKASAAQVREMRAALAATMDGLRAEVTKDSLAVSIAQVHAQSAQIRQQIEDAYSGGGANSDTVRDRNRLLTENIALEAKRIEQLREENAAKDRYFTEDLDVRALRAQGKTGDADRLDLQYRQQRELDEYRRTHDMGNKEYADQYAYLQQVQALERNTKAINALTTSVRNGPAGFKVEPYIQQFAKAMPRGPYPSSPFSPSNPFSPPMSPLSPPMLARTGKLASAPVTIHVTVNESKSPKLTAQEVTRMVATGLDQALGTTSGMNSSRAAALELV